MTDNVDKWQPMVVMLPQAHIDAIQTYAIEMKPNLSAKLQLSIEALANDETAPGDYVIGIILESIIGDYVAKGQLPLMRGWKP